MSYAVTDAGEEDLRSECEVLSDLEPEIDELASQARQCDTIAPEVKPLLDYAWYFAQKAYREVHGRGTCSHLDIQRKPYCQCCAHFAELRNKAESIRRML